MKLGWLIPIAAIALMGLTASATPSPWEQPAANLAEQVAEILGPGQARLTILNMSSIPTEQIPEIRLLLEQDLKTHGVVASGAESANSIRVTLSENARERLWVAEVMEGDQARVAMVSLEAGAARQLEPAGGLTLRKRTLLITADDVLALLETPNGFVALEPEEIVIFNRAGADWQQKRIGIGQKRPLARDPRGIIIPSANREVFTAFLPGTVCDGSYQPAQSAGDWTVHCMENDDPWPIAGPASAGNASSLKAFYNASRNYFTGMVVPAVGAELPPFYSAATVPRQNGFGWLIDGIDGRVQIVENGALKPVAGSRDWGSEFAALRSGCGAGTQIVASGSGAATADSLRAFEIPALEAVPASAPLAMDGTVTALWTAPDDKSLFAVVRGTDDRYEVDRVTALCN
jgi:hypothetical protein